MSVVVIIPAYLPTEALTIEKTIRYLLKTVDGITKNNLYLVWNSDSSNNIKYESLLLSLKSLCQVVYGLGSKSKSSNLNICLNSIPEETDYVVFYDADARPSSHSVHSLLKEIKSNKNYAFVQGNFTFDRGNNFLLKSYDEMENILHNKTLGRINKFKAAFNGHDAIFRYSVLKEVDGFDPNKLLEDADITKSIHDLGYKSFFLSSHVSSSESTKTLGDFLKQRLRWYAGRYQISPFTVFIRLLISVIWLGMYYMYPLQSLVCSFIIGLLIMRFNIVYAFLFLIYPFVVVIMNLYFTFKGMPVKFESTKRDINISGRLRRR